ncbi:MAG TPA: OmpA family protein [Candidatus Angelobacter sp.]|nr:OmpA family protein [Candidatus Angelobacter sp.]
MKLHRIQWLKLISALMILLAVAACSKKKPPAPTPAPPPPAPAPTAILTANPNSIVAGQASTLTWSTDFSSDVSIDGIGKVDPSGSMKVTPSESTTYRLVAKSDSGMKDATARITVTPAASGPPTSSSTSTSSDADAKLFSQNMKDIFFAYDSYEISPESEAAIKADAKFLQQHPGMTFIIEGHCDERGSIEYNLTLGEYRANAAKLALSQQGVPGPRSKTISYGKEKPFCNESTEACWQENRRAHFVYSK